MKSPMTQEQRLHKNDGNPDLPADPEPGDPDDHQYAGDFHLQHGGYIFREPDRHESASAAVGVSYSLMSMIQALGFTLGMGSGNYLSRVLEAGMRKSRADRFHRLLFRDPDRAPVRGRVCRILMCSLRLLGATDTIAPYAKDYAKYILIAAPVMTGSLAMNNLLRFQGLAVYAMIGITTEAS